MQHILRRQPIVCCLIILLLLSNTARAQFLGGPDDGVSTATALNQALGQNIYLGGADDGHAFAFAANLNMGQNIFTGGVDDGVSMSFSAALALGQNIYLGGIDDGTTYAFATAQLLGQNIYLGGADDGFASVTAANQSLGQNIFLGGSNDGWAFAIGSNLTLVPVTLKTFEAQWHNDEDIFTRWITTLESNTRQFEIERSIDGASFETAGTVPAAGNSNTERTYNFIDRNVNSHYSNRPSHFYYRLKTIDIDGQFSYSAIVVLPNRESGNVQMFVVYPNPAQQFITIEFKNAADFKPHVVHLVAADGKILLQQLMNSNKETLQVGQFPSGAYYLKLTEQGKRKSQTIKFIIQH